MNRRDFLTTTTATLAAASLPSNVLAQSAEPAKPATDSRFQFGPRPGPVVKPGEFVFASVHFDHNHIDGMTKSLIDAGGTLKSIYEPDAKKVAAWTKRYPNVKVAKSLQEVLDDPEVKLVAAAAVTSERGPLGCKVMEAGKDYFTDKAPFTTMAQLEQARAVVKKTGK